MTRRFSKSITADSLTGMAFAAEGVRDAVVLLNGPMGCKFYHSTTSQFLTVRPPLYLPDKDGLKVPVDYNYLNDWFFRQPRVPCTYLDGYDYVYGTADKVAEGLKFLRENVEFSLCVIINSPGASLIGDRMEELVRSNFPDKLCVAIESPGFSEDFDEGYENAALEILKAVIGNKGINRNGAGTRAAHGSGLGNVTADGAGQAGRAGGSSKAAAGGSSRTVNVLGLSIWDRYHEGDRAELTRMLALCGISVNCVLCGDCTLEETGRITDADLNLVVNPRAGARCARFLEETASMESYVCDALPVGFEASVKLCADVCARLGCADAVSVLQRECEEKRAYAYSKINAIYQTSGKPDGTRFALEGDAAQVLGYARFFVEYLGMIPECVSVRGNASDAQMETLEKLLLGCGCSEALQKDIRDTGAELVFADANTIASLMTLRKDFCGIEISLPGMGYTDFVPKTHLGVNGVMLLIEQVMNGLMSRL